MCVCVCVCVCVLIHVSFNQKMTTEMITVANFDGALSICTFLQTLNVKRRWKEQNTGEPRALRRTAERARPRTHSPHMNTNGFRWTRTSKVTTWFGSVLIVLLRYRYQH